MKTQLIALNFSQTDICSVLEIAKPAHVAARLEPYERGTYNMGTPGGPQEMVITNESGLYSLLMTSRKPIAKQFKQWVTTEVLPSIRKYGFYDPSPMALARGCDPDDEIWNGGHDKSRLERFYEEVRRFEQENNARFSKAFEGLYPRATLKALDLGLNPSLNAFTKDQKWLYLLSSGFDLFYVYWGDRILTTTERQIRDTLRKLGPEHRRDLLLQAQHMTQARAPLLTDEGDE